MALLVPLLFLMVTVIRIDRLGDQFDRTAAAAQHDAQAIFAGNWHPAGWHTRTQQQRCH